MLALLRSAVAEFSTKFLAKTLFKPAFNELVYIVAPALALVVSETPILLVAVATLPGSKLVKAVVYGDVAEASVFMLKVMLGATVAAEALELNSVSVKLPCMALTLIWYVVLLLKPMAVWPLAPPHPV